MHRRPNTWALVLAAGEGSRLRTLTTTASGLAVPKQFCSLRGGPSLLEEALRRAARVAAPDRVCTVVAAQHRRWWEPPLRALPERNVIAQPENRGTAHGILYPLLHIAARDPDATLLLLPADHHVRDEAALAQSLQRATALAAEYRRTTFMLGVAPAEADPELGYIVPAEAGYAGAARVLQFVEKPSLPLAMELLARGALWNVFIIAASVRALLDLCERRLGPTVAEMRAIVDALRGADPAASTAADDLYRRLPAVDFSRDVIEGQESRLRVVSVPDCGWTDLGTPQRVAETIRRLSRDRCPAQSVLTVSSYLNLAFAHARLQRGIPASATRGALT